MPGSEVTLRATLEQVEKATGQTPPELQDLPKLPDCASHVWGWFHQLSSKRTAGMGINPITYSDVDAWARLYGIKPKIWELDALTAIDNEYLNVAAEEHQQSLKKTKKGGHNG